MDVLVGTAASLRIDFETETGLVVADPGSVRYDLFDQLGVPLSGETGLTIGETGVTVAIPADKHTIAVGRDFERRVVLARWDANGPTFQRRVAYRVVPFIFFSATPADVRTLLGLGIDELQDREIDLYAAYLSISDDVTRAVLDAALVVGTRVETEANNAIIAEAALALLPSLRIRTGMSITDGDQKFERFRTAPDWDKLEGDLRTARSSAIASINPGTGNTAQTLADFTSPTDAITG